jgi:hypothetical protein
MTMWTERTGLIRWTTATIASAKADYGRDYQPLIGKRQQRLRRDVGPREHGNSIREGTYTTSNWPINRATSQVSRVLEGRHFRAVLVRNRSNARERPQPDVCCYQATPAYELLILSERTEGASRWDAIFGVGNSGYWIGWAADPGRSQGATPEKANAVSGALSIDPIHIKKRQRGRSLRDPACRVGQIAW